MLQSHTPRTLCLVDEFGKGTMPVDGIALLAACVKHFAAAGKTAAIFSSFELNLYFYFNAYYFHAGSLCMFVLHVTEILQDNVLDQSTLNRVSCFRMETLDVTHHSVEQFGA